MYCLQKKDALNLYEKYSNKMYNPNYFESIVAINAKECIDRKYLACANHRSKAICITVNRVQDTHMNDFDSITKTDIYTLSSLYNIENNKLNIKRIASKKTNKIHVDSTFFILEKPSKEIQRNQKYNIIKRLIILLKNIKYLSTVNLRDEHWYMSRAIASKVESDLQQVLLKKDK